MAARLNCSATIHAQGHKLTPESTIRENNHVPFEKLLMTALITGAMLGTGLAQASSAVSSACASLEFMAKMLAVNTLLPADRDSRHELQEMNQQMLALNRMACGPVLLTENARYSSHYDNGRLASSDLTQHAWYFPNGQLFVARPAGTPRCITPMASRWPTAGCVVVKPFTGQWQSGHLQFPHHQ